MNLTAHRDPEAIVRRLILDALALGRMLPEGSSLADLGSGAGFPGLPLAVLRPACRITLVEARERRHHFQRMAVRELGLRNVEAIRGRIETLAARPHRLVVAQALAAPRRALAWMLAWSEVGGTLAVPISPAQAGTPPALPKGVRLLPVRRYRVPLGGPERAVWLAAVEGKASSAGRAPAPCGT